MLKLSGTFDVPMDSPPVDDFPGGATPDIGQSVVTFYVGESASPLASLQAALLRGYNGGAWNGVPGGGVGAIVSSDAAAGPAGVYGVGMGVSSDGVVAGMPLNNVSVSTIAGATSVLGTRPAPVTTPPPASDPESTSTDDDRRTGLHKPTGKKPRIEVGTVRRDKKHLGR